MLEITSGNIIIVIICLLLAYISYKIIRWLFPLIIILLLAYIIYMFLF